MRIFKSNIYTLTNGCQEATRVLTLDVSVVAFSPTSFVLFCSHKKLEVFLKDLRVPATTPQHECSPEVRRATHAHHISTPQNIAQSHKVYSSRGLC